MDDIEVNQEIRVESDSTFIGESGKYFTIPFKTTHPNVKVKPKNEFSKIILQDSGWSKWPFLHKDWDSF
jgi:hypothetical protein